jgi:hypothetical protein
MYNATDYLLNMDNMMRHHLQGVCKIEETSSQNTSKVHAKRVQHRKYIQCHRLLTKRGYYGDPPHAKRVQHRRNTFARTDKACATAKKQKGEEGQRNYVSCHRLLTKHG